MQLEQADHIQVQLLEDADRMVAAEQVGHKQLEQEDVAVERADRKQLEQADHIQVQLQVDAGRTVAAEQADHTAAVEQEDAVAAWCKEKEQNHKDWQEHKGCKQKEEHKGCYHKKHRPELNQHCDDQ